MPEILGMFPEVIERGASNVTPHRATLNADITTRNLPVVVSFQMWRDSTGSSPFDYHTVMADQSRVPGNTMIQVSATFTGLKPGTYYLWKVFLYISTGGHVYATGCALNPCVTPTGIPLVTTLPANNIIKDGATLNGNVYANDLSTKVTFEYGETTNYGNTATASQSPISGEMISDDGCAAIDDRGVFYTTNPAVLLPENHLPMRAFYFTHDGTGKGSFTSNLTGLQPGTTYYRAYATNGHRGAAGTIISFTTTR